MDHKVIPYSVVRERYDNSGAHVGYAPKLLDVDGKPVIDRELNQLTGNDLQLQLAHTPAVKPAHIEHNHSVIPMIFSGYFEDQANRQGSPDATTSVAANRRDNVYTLLSNGPSLAAPTVH